MKLRTWLQGAGVAALILFPFYRSLLAMAGEVRMHASASVTSWALSLVANLILVSLLSALLGAWLRGTSIVNWLRFLMPAFVLASLLEIIQIARAGWESTHLWLTVWLVTIFLSLLLRRRWRSGEKLLFRLSQAVLVGVGFFCIFVVSQLLFFAVWHASPNSIPETIPETSSSADRPRIIWILFDGLSYNQVFGDRYPDLELPAFDNLRSFSNVFTDVQPAGGSTELAIPSILLNDAITKVNYTEKNNLEVGTAIGPSYPFDPTRTPFAMARHYGLTTGVVGWYNPYCSLLSPYLNQCYWTGSLSLRKSSALRYFWQDFIHPWSLYGTIFIHPRQMFSENYRKLFVEDLMRRLDIEDIQDAGNRVHVYQDLMQHAVSMIDPAGPDFVFLHLPLPHQAGFYNRRTQQFDDSGNRSYIDNVALTDRTLGELLEILEKSPRWKNTSVVICGDHSWRTYLWRDTKYWTPEDEAASHGGVFDSRPLLIVHLAGQTTPATVTEPFPLLRVHDILNDLVMGKQASFPLN